MFLTSSTARFSPREHVDNFAPESRRAPNAKLAGTRRGPNDEQPGRPLKEPPSLPARVGPAELDLLGKLVAIRAPRELDGIFRRAGGVWEPGSRRWLIERRRLGPVIRALRKATDPLFRRSGIALD